MLLNGSFSGCFPVVAVPVHACMVPFVLGACPCLSSKSPGWRVSMAGCPAPHQPHCSGGNLAAGVSDVSGQFEQKEWVLSGDWQRRACCLLDGFQEQIWASLSSTWASLIGNIFMCPEGWKCDLTFVLPLISEQVLPREVLKRHRHCPPSTVKLQLAINVNISYLSLLLPPPPPPRLHFVWANRKV